MRTNPVVIRRVLARLHRAGLVQSIRGKSGGFELARDPGKITGLDVYRALEPGGLFAQHARGPEPRCEVSCAMKDLLGHTFRELDQAVEQRLGRITIAALASEV